MRRRLFTFLYLASVIACVCLCVLWVRSYRIADAWGWSCGKRSVQCGLASGRLRVDTSKLGEDGGSWREPSMAHARYAADGDPPTKRLPATIWNLGFAAEYRVVGRNYESWLALVPMWAVLLLMGSAAAAFRRLGKRALRRERRHAGLCEGCGYNLRATPERCPECGLELATDEHG